MPMAAAYSTTTVLVADDECPDVSIAITVTVWGPADVYVCVARDPPSGGETDAVLSPKLKTKLAIGVPSVSIDPDASATTVSGALPLFGDTESTTTGGLSGTGVGVGVGLLPAVG